MLTLDGKLLMSLTMMRTRGPAAFSRYWFSVSIHMTSANWLTISAKICGVRSRVGRPWICAHAGWASREFGSVPALGLKLERHGVKQTSV